MERKVIELDQGWDYMQKGITKLKRILEGLPEPQFNSEEYMMLYTTIYNMCTQKFPFDYSQQLYDKYKEAFEAYITSTVMPSLREKHDEYMLREFVQRWTSHKVMVRWLSRFFHYLDRYFIAHRSLPALNEVGLTCFRDLVYKEVNANARVAVIGLIDKEREGERIDRALLKNVIDIFVEIGMGQMDAYETDFEAHMLCDTGEYYSRKASNWILEYSCPGYMSKAEECLKKERDRVFHYLHSSSEQKLVEKVQNELLVVYATQLLEKEHSGCRALLRDDKVEDISRIYRPCHKIPKGLDPVASVFKQHVTAEGTSLVQSAEDATSNQVKHGTILEAISCVDGVFLIQDLRITKSVRFEGNKGKPDSILSEVNKEDCSKCFFLSDTIAIGFSGFSDLVQKLEVWLRQKIENVSEVSLQSVAHLAHNFVNNVYDRRYDVWNGEHMGLCHIILAGVEKTGGTDLSIYSIKPDSEKPEHHTDFVVRSCFAKEVDLILKKRYDSEMKYEEVIQLAEETVLRAAMHVNDCGNGVEIFHIKANAGAIWESISKRSILDLYPKYYTELYDRCTLFLRCPGEIGPLDLELISKKLTPRGNGAKAKYVLLGWTGDKAIVRLRFKRRNIQQMAIVSCDNYDFVHIKDSDEKAENMFFMATKKIKRRNRKNKQVSAFMIEVFDVSQSPCASDHIKSIFSGKECITAPDRLL